MGRNIDHWIIEQNIIRFRELLAREEDALKRKVIEGLMAQEEAKLIEKRTG